MVYNGPGPDHYTSTNSYKSYKSYKSYYQELQELLPGHQALGSLL